MKRLFVLLAMLLAFSLANAADGKSGNGGNCPYTGSWLGYNFDGMVSWTSQVHEISKKHGTMLLEIPFPASSFNDYGFDAVAILSNMKGEWKKIGGNSYFYRAVSFAYDANGEAEWIAKLTGTATVLGNDCDLLHLTDTVLRVYYANADPFLADDSYFWSQEFDEHYGYRIRADLP